VDDLLQVADKLVDLATLWDGASLMADDRIELWTLLQQVWGEVEPLAVGRHVRVRFTTDVQARELATLYGSERWMRRVFVECLHGAVRLAPHGGEIEVEHLQDGPRAASCCATARCSADGCRGADAIGQQLCRHVLALHGGRLLRRAGRRAPPSGDRAAHRCAPPRRATRRLAIAQAQHYARDLAALVNRARRRPGRGATAPIDALSNPHRLTAGTRRSRLPAPRRRSHEARTDRRRPGRHPQADPHDAGVRGLRDPRSQRRRLGLRLAREVKPDLMLLDVMMPGELDGLQVCHRVKRDGHRSTSAWCCSPPAARRATARPAAKPAPTSTWSSPSARCS
jgi:CheY-like chemotaxis protein